MLGMPPKVLLVCDDRETAQIWIHSLQQRQHSVVLALNAEDALDLWLYEIPDLIVIDSCGPSLNEVKLTERLRRETVLPILVFTQTNNEGHILRIYRAGADECAAKPVSPALFLAKTTALLRRSSVIPTTVLDRLQVGNLVLDPARREISLKDGPVYRLTNLEFRFLHLLMSYPGRAFDRELILERVWGDFSPGSNRLLKNLVYRLRRKIEPDPAAPRYILTEAGVGYKIHA